MITYEQVRNYFRYENGRLFWKFVSTNRIKIGDEAGNLKKDGYYKIQVNGKGYLRHRLIWLYFNGYIPENNIDHINRDKSDDRIENLREVSQTCNLRNTGNFSHNTSGVKGVYFHKSSKKWNSIITINHKIYSLGLYEDFNEAVLARYAAEQCLGWKGCDSNSPAKQYCLKNNLIKS